MLQEILKECEMAKEYLQAMKKGTAYNEDCNNVIMHLAKIQGKVNTLIITSVGVTLPSYKSQAFKDWAISEGYTIEPYGLLGKDNKKYCICDIHKEYIKLLEEGN